MTLNQKLAIAAGTLGALALLAGSRTPSSSVDLGALAQAVEREEDHVDALELAEMLKAQQPHLRVIDVRTAAEYEEFHIPRAEHVELSRITDLQVSPADTVVIYSAGGTHGAQAWFFLRAMGVSSVYFLRGGIDEWLDEVMAYPSNASERQKEIARYFGGTAGSASPAASVAEKVRRVKGRTC